MTRTLALVLALLGGFLLLTRARGRRLPKGAILGLVLAAVVPALGHLYVLRRSSLPYVAGMLLLGLALHAFLDPMQSFVILSLVSTGLMYYRLVVRLER